MNNNEKWFASMMITALSLTMDHQLLWRRLDFKERRGEIEILVSEYYVIGDKIRAAEEAINRVGLNKGLRYLSDENKRKIDRFKVEIASLRRKGRAIKRMIRRERKTIDKLAKRPAKNVKRFYISISRDPHNFDDFAKNAGFIVVYEKVNSVVAEMYYGDPSDPFAKSNVVIDDTHCPNLITLMIMIRADECVVSDEKNEAESYKNSVLTVD